MTSKMTPQEWLGKANWEGGIYEGFDYGLLPSDLDDSDPEFNARVAVAAVRATEYRKAENRLLDYAESQDYNLEQ